jgi:hypothetical protein
MAARHGSRDGTWPGPAAIDHLARYYGKPLETAESWLRERDRVADPAVVGLPDDRLGEVRGSAR